MVRILCTLLCSDKGCCRCTMVAVSYIECRNLSEYFSNAVDVRLIVNHPEMVSEAVFRHEIILCFAGNIFVHDGIDLGVVRIGEEYRLYVRILDAYMDHAVFFLVLTGKLMFLDLALSIVVGMRTHHESVLCTTLHCLGIYIIIRLLVLHEPSFLLPCLEIFDSLVVSRLTVFVDDRFEVDFWLGYVEKGLLASLCLCFH